MLFLSHFPLPFFNLSSPPPSSSGPSHFPLRFFTQSIPPPLFRISHSGSRHEEATLIYLWAFWTLFFFCTCLTWSRSSCNPIYRHSGRVTLGRLRAVLYLATVCSYYPSGFRGGFIVGTILPLLYVIANY